MNLLHGCSTSIRINICRFFQCFIKTNVYNLIVAKRDLSVSVNCSFISFINDVVVRHWTVYFKVKSGNICDEFVSSFVFKKRKNKI